MSDKGRILIIDDDNAFLAVTASLLEHEGYECECAIDAAGAIHNLQSICFDLVISDIEMPGNQNLALIRELPQLQAGIPVIIMTGHPTTQTAIEALKLSVTSYLLKPADMGELLEAVRTSIERYRKLKALRENRSHVAKLLQELEDIEDAMASAKGGEPDGLDDAYLNLILKNIAQSVGDLQRFGEFIGRQKSDHAQSKGMDEKAKETLIETLRNGATVLEKSRSSFKSKELGELRHRLKTLADSMDKKSK